MRADITELQYRGLQTAIDTVFDYEVNIFKYLQPYNESLVRLGSKHDGGYAIPEVLLRKDIKLLSFGVGWDCNFETDWYKLVSQKIVSYDSTDLYLEDSIYDKNARFENIFIDSEAIKRIVDKEATELFFVKMDIEGAEYHDTLQQLIENEYCVGFAVEFHGIRIDEDGNEIDTTVKFRNFVELAKNKYNIVHVHCNNVPYQGMALHEIHSKNEFPADVLEITFLRRDYCSTTALRKNTLLDIDFPNVGGSPEINLIF